MNAQRYSMNAQRYSMNAQRYSINANDVPGGCGTWDILSKIARQSWYLKVSCMLMP